MKHAIVHLTKICSFGLVKYAPSQQQQHKQQHKQQQRTYFMKFSFALTTWTSTTYGSKTQIHTFGEATTTTTTTTSRHHKFPPNLKKCTFPGKRKRYFNCIPVIAMTKKITAKKTSMSVVKMNSYSFSRGIIAKTANNKQIMW